MSNERKSGIYCIENIQTNKKYIGQSVSIEDRWSKHMSELNNGLHHNDYLQKAWNKYGKESFKFTVLEYCDINKLNDRERYYIEYYDSMNRDKGYNLKSGGQDHIVYSEETKKKLSNSIRKSYLDSELIKVRSKDAIKQWSNPEIRKKMIKNNGMYGKHHTEEARKKMSDAAKGRISRRRNRTNVLCIELNKRFNDAATAGKELSLDGSGILKVCKGERKTCGGYHWKFINN